MKTINFHYYLVNMYYLWMLLGWMKLIVHFLKSFGLASQKHKKPERIKPVFLYLSKLLFFKILFFFSTIRQIPSLPGMRDITIWGHAASWGRPFSMRASWHVNIQPIEKVTLVFRAKSKAGMVYFSLQGSRRSIKTISVLLLQGIGIRLSCLTTLLIWNY